MEYRSDTFAGQGYDAQIAETRRLLGGGDTFTVAELAERLDISKSRCNDIFSELIRAGEVTASGRPRRIASAP